MLEAGSLIRRGALLIDPNVGRIVGHLQETVGFANVAAGLNPLTAIPQMANVALGIVTAVQNEQIKNRVDIMQQMLGSVQSLQIANLAVSAASIGVSAAGTALVLQRIERLRKDIAGFEKQVDDFRDEWRMSEILALLDKTLTRVKRVDRANQRRNGRVVLEEAEKELHDVFDALARRLRMVVAMTSIPYSMLETLIEGMVLAAETRIKALFLLDDGNEAEASAQEQLLAFVQISRSLPRDTMTLRLTDVPNLNDAVQRLTQNMSEMRLRLASIPPLLTSLRGHNLQPSSYLSAAEDEQDAPLMFLPSIADGAA